MRAKNRVSVKRITSQARSIDRGLRDTLLPLCAAAAVVAIAAFTAAPTPNSVPRFERFREDPRDFAVFSFLVWRAAASSTETLP